MKHGLWILLAAALAGCGAGTKDGGGTQDEAGSDAAPVEYQGQVILGTPVSGAEVRVMVFNEFNDWVEVSHATTDNDGVFWVSVPGDQLDRPLRLSVSGAEAEYVELADGSKKTLGEEGLLLAYLESGSNYLGATVHVTAWTTLAACAADAFQEGFEMESTGSWPDAMKTGRNRIRNHLTRDEDLDLLTTTPGALSLGYLPYPGSSATVGLADAGLSVLARTEYVTGKKTSAVLTTLLCEDLANGLLEDPEERDEVVQAAGVGVVPPLTTRYALASATHAFLGGERNLSWITSEMIAGPGDYYDVVSMDDGPLYLPDPPRIRFDPIPPVLAFSEDSPADGAVVGVAPVVFEVTGSDPYGPVAITFDGTTPSGLLPPDVEPTSDTRALEIVPALVEHQGEVTFHFSGVDEQGNRADISRCLVLDTVAPELTVIDPVQGECSDAWPDAVIVEAEDATSGVTDVVMEDGAACVPGDDDTWSCPQPDAETNAVTVVATDGGGNQTEVEVILCVDPDPPVISFDALFENVWWGPAFYGTEFVVEITDQSEVEAWTIVDAGGQPVVPVAEDPIDGGVAITCALPDDETGTYTLTVTASDSHGNEAEQARSLLWDGDPPEFDDSVPGGAVFGSPQQVTFTVFVQDEDSGMAQVEVVSPGAWTVEEEPETQDDQGTMRVRISGAPAPATVEDILWVSLSATDAVGNVCEHAVEVTMDLSAPALGWTSTPAPDESDCVVTLHDDGEVEYDCPDPEEVLNAASCEEICPPIVKFATRLDYAVPSDLWVKDIPRLEFSIHDTCPLEDMMSCPMAFAWTFYREDVALLSHQIVSEPNFLGDVEFEGEVQEVAVYHESILLDAQGLFDTSAGEADIGDWCTPDRVEFSYTDLGGNSTVRDVFLDFTILPPPVFFSWTSHADLDGVLLAPLAMFMDDAAHFMEQVAGSSGVEAAHFTLTNPTTVPALVDVPWAPYHYLGVYTRRGYLGDAALTEGCGEALCATATGPLDDLDFGDGVCSVPESFETEIDNSTSPVTIGFVDPDETLEYIDEWLVLEPGEIVEGSVMVSMEPVPAVLPAEVFPVWNPAEQSFVDLPIHFLDTEDQWAACGMSESGPRLFRTTPALNRVTSETDPATSDLVVATQVVGGGQPVTASHPAGWYVTYLNQWPANFAVPNL